ncbi:bifunctional phosphoribosylaminoimidazolecarboxamide formyltransferase/IMP cyclohydrolase [Candidatus Synechococcus calcipolaris G9]|uniref:Bifunctional purine biosynthesis protein PurH n=1 Tax=Candidatus Synechococcus calcipolaris G9 TaxID=1497997 RepID=A0ABT6EXF8_9SYNE|nr:bifunctional phosphoribosylaminoimidazolecarboxamide formyltransferase/IMP cyclohydrolase [Candidatus Synechococcus calcipolaris]MDG2990479.1 bifunctional phosphoribosylaminoimidazolecarboxamide formyltransferase/IMP cyclohydrolase [Candidatus Synechococcus calcipolaris G9]
MARYALLSVSDKTGLIELAQSLVDRFGFELISSGGTSTVLEAAGIPTIKVADYTGFPEILAGRVKTLHPRIHGGILARRDRPEDQRDLGEHNVYPIDLVVVNLYPFQATIAQPNVSLAEAIEQIDIGGPTLIRAAAKNFAHVTVLSSPTQYADYLAELRQRETPSAEFRHECAQAAFWHTAAYDQAIAAYLSQSPTTTPTPEALPAVFNLTGRRQQLLRYGENPHQQAAWYYTGSMATGWAAANLVQGKELSFNNLLDLEAARSIIREFCGDRVQPTAVVVKHTNPCGVAEGKTIADAYQRALAADSVSAFGGIVALNQAIDPETATVLSKTFLECVVAPDCHPDALKILKAKPKLRLLLLPDLTQGPDVAIRAIAGGFLVQDIHHVPSVAEDWEVVTETKPTPDQLEELIFAWKVVKHVKSNAIVVSRDRATLGIGAGQMNRVGSVQIALSDAEDKAKGAVLASDGFFPFADSVQTAAIAGISCIIQPGGSLRDNDSIQAANEAGIVMICTNRRYFRH